MKNSCKFRDNRVIMVHLRFTSLLLGLLLSLVVAPIIPTALANKGVVMTNNDQALGNAKEISDETKMVTGTQSGRLKGRKIGVEDVPKKEARNEMNTGKDMNSPTNSCRAPNTEDSGAFEPASLPNTHCRSQDSYQPMGTQKLLEATAEIFKMMNKDYHQKARRRPPINNNLPLADRRKPSTSNNLP